MCCLSCLPICTSSVRTLSVNFLFVTSSCSCRKSLCWIGCCLLLPHLSFSSNSWRRWDCNDKTVQKPPQQRWRDCNVGASEISFDFVAWPPWQWRWRHVGDLLEFLTAARLWWQDCTATSSMTVARLRYWRISITFNLAVWHLWQWQWRHVGNLLKFLTAVTLQCQRIGSLTTTACNALANSLIQRCLWVGSSVVACWLALAAGESSKILFRN